MEPKTPDFSLDPTSPPHFSYDFNSESPNAPNFDAFSYSSGFDTSPRLGGFSALALGTHTAPTSAPPSYFAPHGYPSSSASPTAHSFSSASTSGRPYTPIEGSDLATISPPLTLAANASASYSEGDDVAATTATRTDPAGRRSSTNSPPSSASQAYSARSSSSARYNPLAGARPARPVRRSANRRGLRRGEDDDLSDEEPDPAHDEPMDVGVSSSDIIQRRREEIRRQRIESEQRRRDELRDGYAKLKYALPISNQKSSKVSLLDRAVTYVRQLESSSAATQARLDVAEKELARLRGVNEQLMRNLADQHRAVTLTALAAAQAQQSQSQSQSGSEPPSPPGKKSNKKTSSF